MKENGKRFRTWRILPFVLLVLLVFSTAGCDYVFNLPADTSSPDTSAEDIPGIEDETTTPDPDQTKGEEDTLPGDETEDSSEEETTRAPETDEQGNVLTYIDPLTGLRDTVNVTGIRPVALVFDNVSAAAPQSGISKSDILIETMVEYGISRLIGITNDYLDADGKGTLDVFGPIRSTRHYMVSISQAFDPLMVGAGYSPQGYAIIKNLNLDYIDGVHDRYSLQGFYRDVERYQNNGYEHSLMITGKGITKLAEYNTYSYKQKTADAFNFIEEGKNMYLAGGAAKHVILKYSLYQQVQLVYSSTTGTYYRYHFGDQPHLDAENGEQLNFKNVLILFAPTRNIEGDTEGRIDVTMTGSGDGYYISDGRYVAIRWSRATDTSELNITGLAGEKITLNRGKTFITVVNSSLKGTPSIELNYKLGN